MSKEIAKETKKSSSNIHPNSNPPPLFKNPIDAFQINSAREFHRLTTGSRFPQRKSQGQIQPIAETPKQSENTTIKNSITPSTKSCNHNNPFCHHCGQVIIPAPVATFPLKDNPSICINEKWYVTTQRLPILNATEIEKFEEILNGIPVPEMIFGNNKVEIILKSKSDAIDFHIMFNTLDALKLVERNPENLLQVSYADSWFKSRQLKHKNSENVSLEVYKPYDWTYTSKYKGTMIKLNPKLTWTTDNDDSFRIPINKLTSNNPIKFFDDMILYEDELGDNGISMLNIKIRVMSDCLLLLQRLFIRVDDVLVRIIDTRLYIDFDDNFIIREQKVMQDQYSNIMKKVIGPDPKKMMRDIHWCSTILPVIEITREYMSLAVLEE